MTKLILALDTDDENRIADLLYDVNHLVDWVKVGHQAVCSVGLSTIAKACGLLDQKVFVDFKFHDIPSTVRRNVELLTRYNVGMLTVHTMGGHTMLEAAAQAAKAAENPPIVLGVTILTSNIVSIRSVVKLATNARNAGLDGVVCSPLEVEAVRRACGKDFLIVTPGIRPLWSKTDDHARYATPIEMTRLGADYVVVGRPILESDEPVEAAERIVEELNGQLPAAS